MEKYKNIAHLSILAGIATSILNRATPASL
jgi:hypothetical protein